MPGTVFNFCFDTQRHMRVHFTLVALVLLAAWTLGIDGTPFLHLLAAAAVVLVAEMINTALEAATELIVEGYDVRVKVVKDVAAGAVLIAQSMRLSWQYWCLAVQSGWERCSATGLSLQHRHT